MICSPSIVFSDAEFAVDIVLLLRKREELDHERDQRALRGHVEAERETCDDDFVQLRRKHVNDEAEEEPDPEMDPHQVGRLAPMSQVIGRRTLGRRLLCHGQLALPL